MTKLRKYYRPAFCKFKLDLAFDSEIPKFRLFDGSSGKRVEVEMTSFEDALNYFRGMTKHRMIIHIFKNLRRKNGASWREEKIRFSAKSNCN